MISVRNFIIIVTSCLFIYIVLPKKSSKEFISLEYDATSKCEFQGWRGDTSGKTHFDYRCTLYIEGLPSHDIFTTLREIKSNTMVKINDSGGDFRVPEFKIKYVFNYSKQLGCFVSNSSKCLEIDSRVEKMIRVFHEDLIIK